MMARHHHLSFRRKEATTQYLKPKAEFIACQASERCSCRIVTQSKTLLVYIEFGILPGVVITNRELSLIDWVGFKIGSGATC